MNLDLKGRTAVVCGSTQGLGFASAAELALLGCRVILLARNEESLKEAVSNLSAAGGQQHDYRVADFGDTAAVKKAINSIVDKETVHILVNNTGGPPGGTALQAS